MTQIDVMQIDGWRIDVAARRAERAGVTKQLSPRAIRLLTVLAEDPGATRSRQDLLDRVWPDVYVSDESLTQVVSELRRTLENRSLIATIARGGYRLTQPLVGGTAPTPRSGGAPLHGLTLDAYTLCIEARACFARSGEGAYRSFVELAAQAVAAAPNFAEARATHALALFKRHVQWSEGEELFEAAMAEAEAALKLDPDNALAHLICCAGFFADKQTDRAARALEAALALAPNDPFIHFNGGVILLSVGNRRTAAALVQKAGQLGPDLFGPDLLLTRILASSDPQRARLCAQRALRKVKDELSIDPHSMRGLYALGPLLAQLGDHRAAQAALDSIAHHDSPVEYFRALGYAQIGDVSSAIERLGFLAMRGWRQGCILEHDHGFRPLFEDRRFRRLHGELMAA